MPSNPFHGKAGGGAFLPAPSALIPAGIAVVKTHIPIKNCFLVCYIPERLMNASSAGFVS